MYFSINTSCLIKDGEDKELIFFLATLFIMEKLGEAFRNFETLTLLWIDIGSHGDAPLTNLLPTFI